MNPALRETASRFTARMVGSRFAKPIVRVVLAAAGLLLLAFIGKTAVAGAMASAPAVALPALAAPLTAATTATTVTPAAPPSPGPPAAPAAPLQDAPGPSSPPSAHTRATAEDPVILNTATIDDLRRLPGVGEKKATAIVALRTRLGGRLHAVEDLLKVKGIGRTTLRHLRPLVRLDPAPLPAGAGQAADAGAGESPR